MSISRIMTALAAGLALSITSLSANAAVISANWTDETQGSLNGVGFTVSGGTGPFWEIISFDFDEAGHSFAPLVGVDAMSYGADSDLVITFDNPVTNLLLYAGLWRGEFTFAFDDPAVSYAFSEPFDILSGFTFSTIAGQIITIDDDDVVFENGVLRFPDAITALTILSDGGPGGVAGSSAQVLTFALETSEIPAPGALPLMLTAIGGLAFWRRRQPRRR